MKTKLFVATILAVSLLTVFPARAASRSPTQSASKKIRNEIEKKVEEKVKGIINEKKKRGWIGTVVNKDGIGLKIETSQGEKREILVDEETTFISSKRTAISIKEIVVGKKILAMGYLNGKNILAGKRIIVLKKEEPINHFAAFGTISDKSISQKIITLIPAANKNKALEILITSKTKISSFKEKDLAYGDLKTGSKIALIYKNDPKGAEKQALVVKIISSPRPTDTPAPSPTTSPISR